MSCTDWLFRRPSCNVPPARLSAPVTNFARSQISISTPLQALQQKVTGRNDPYPLLPSAQCPALSPIVNALLCVLRTRLRSSGQTRLRNSIVLGCRAPNDRAAESADDPRLAVSVVSVWKVQTSGPAMWRLTKPSLPGSLSSVVWSRQVEARYLDTTTVCCTRDQ